MPEIVGMVHMVATAVVRFGCRSPYPVYSSIQCSSDHIPSHQQTLLLNQCACAKVSKDECGFRNQKHFALGVYV
jgi:hypothetical protein